MNKSIEKLKNDKEMVKFIPFSENDDNEVLLHLQAINFYKIFKTIFGSGYEIILGHEKPNTELIHVLIVNYSYAIELMLKSIICLCGIKFKRTHDLISLLKQAIDLHKNINYLYNNQEYIILLEQIKSTRIRYGNGTIVLRNDKEESLNNKPLQVFSEATEEIFYKLKKAYDDIVKTKNNT